MGALRYTGLKEIGCIERSDVTFYCKRGKDFVFVRTQSGVDIHDTAQFPFLYISKHKYAEEVLVVGADVVMDYLRATGKWDRDGSNIGLLHNIGRCGSTLLTNMVQKTQQCVVLSEPISLLEVTKEFGERGVPVAPESTDECELVKTMFLLLTPDPTKRYFIKTHSQVAFLMPICHALFPEMRETFMHRALRPTITSFKRAFLDGLNSLPFSFVEGFLTPYLSATLKSFWREIRVEDAEHLMVYMTLATVQLYLTETISREDMRSFSYESLLEDREGFTTAYLREIGLGAEHVPAALTAMETDSQKNSALRKSKLSKNATGASEKALEWGREIGARMGVRLEGPEYEFANLAHGWNEQEQDDMQ